MFNLGDRVEYIGTELENNLEPGKPMYGTITYIKFEKDQYQPYLLCFDERYDYSLHDGHTSKGCGNFLEEFYDYDGYSDSFELKKHRGWFVNAKDMVLIKAKKGNTKIFKEGRQ